MLLHGIPCLRLSGPDGASALVAAHGAQLIAWTPACGGERIYLSPRSDFVAGRAIRGGVPVIFPQFAGFGSGTRHGFARLLGWRMAAVAEGGRPAAVFTLSDQEAAEAIRAAGWRGRFDLRLSITLDAQDLTIRFTVGNPGPEPIRFAAALHTYLKVSDPGSVRLEGLTGAPFRDQAAGGALRSDSAPALALAGEIDRIYRAPAEPLLLGDGMRRLRIASAGFGEVVVWNPGALKAAALADLPPGGEREFLCVEAARIDPPVSLPSGETWEGVQRLEALA